MKGMESPGKGRRTRCSLGLHRWVRVPTTWTLGFPGCSSAHNSECARCGKTRWVSGPLTHESVRHLRAAGLHEVADVAERYVRG